MTVHLKGSTFVAFAAVSMALSGCFGSSSGGGITKEVDARIEKIQALGETTTMPTELNATYKGAMGLEVYEENDDGTKGDKTAELTGVLSIMVDWEDGSDAEVTGTASKFRGTAFGDDGKKRKISPAGELTVVADSGIIEKDDGTLKFDMSGELKDGKDTADVELSFLGNFYGEDAEGVTGDVTGTLEDDDDSEIVEGRFYLEKD